MKRYPIDSLGDKCPRCKLPWWIMGKGDQIDVSAVKSEDSDSGAVSLYRCLGCGHEYEVEFARGSVFLA